MTTAKLPGARAVTSSQCLGCEQMGDEFLHNVSDKHAKMHMEIRDSVFARLFTSSPHIPSHAPRSGGEGGRACRGSTPDSQGRGCSSST